MEEKDNMTAQQPTKQEDPTLEPSSEGTFQQALQGPVLYQDEKGRLLRYQTYEQGVLHGESRHYGENADLTQRFFYDHGDMHGPFEAFEDGKIVLGTHYVKGLQHGQATFYDENGLVKMRTHYQEGRLQGPCLTYDEQGNVQQIFHYHDNVKHGPSLIYFPSGTVLERGFYAHDLKEGSFYSFYETGVLREVTVYQGGCLMSPPTQYDAKGKPL
jgi:antitoxin component YwqK of YwqJK toxin-antitoxin module